MCVKLVNLVCNESDSIESVKNTDSECFFHKWKCYSCGYLVVHANVKTSYIAAGAEADIGEMFKSQDLSCDFPIFRKVQVFWLNFVFKFIDIRRVMADSRAFHIRWEIGLENIWFFLKIILFPFLLHSENICFILKIITLFLKIFAQSCSKCLYSIEKYYKSVS